jgi:hypothetical protein
MSEFRSHAEMVAEWWAYAMSQAADLVAQHERVDPDVISQTAHDSTHDKGQTHE